MEAKSWQTIDSSAPVTDQPYNQARPGLVLSTSVADELLVEHCRDRPSDCSPFQSYLGNRLRFYLQRHFRTLSDVI
jgi:hypothetical protein